MVVNDFRFCNGASGQAALDELRVGEGVGPYVVLLHFG